MTEQLATTNELRYEVQPAVLTADFDAMQKRLDELMEPYQDLTAEVVATMDMKEAKAARADLNAMSKSLNDARKAIKREYNKPLQEFEAKVKELDAQILAPKALLDAGINQREEADKQARYEALEEVYWSFAPALAELVPMEKVIDPRWLNKSYGEKKAENALCEKVAAVNADWNTLKDAQLHFPSETERRFFDTLNLRDALAYDREEWEKQQALEAMKAEVGEVQQAQQPQIIAPTPQMMADGTEYRFTITVPEQVFFTSVIEATALKNHLAKLGITAYMTKSKEAVA